MRSELADKLLAKVLNWEEEDIVKYRPEIDILSQIKYDEYQQYFPGLRFTESLASWLHKVNPKDREILFNFIRERLIFISTREMNQLISQAFPDYIKPYLHDKSSKIIGCSKYEVNRIEENEAYSILLRKTLFLGLSDGARTDVIRRFNPFISHEQVLPFYLIPEEKFEELKEKLQKDLKNISNKTDDNRFSHLILLDDFTASGTSYFKFKESVGEFKGKVSKILEKLKHKNSFSKLFDFNSLCIIIVIYVATTKAIEKINEAIKMWKEINPDLQFQIKFETIFEIPESVCVTTKEEKLCEVLNKYYDSTIETESYLKGSHKNPYLGFDECGLPIILNHNTPNNSLTILWNERHFNTINDKPTGLFPRVSRHKK